MNVRSLLITLSLLLCSVAAQAQSEPGLFVNKRYDVFFRMKSAVVDTTFKNNANSFAQIKYDLERTVSLTGETPDTIYVLSATSPEGALWYNQSLNKLRARSLRKAMISLHPELKDAAFVVKERYEEWERLRDILMDASDFPQRDTMLFIIDSTPDKTNVEKQLRGCEEGWAYMMSNYMYALRNSAIRMAVASPTYEMRTSEKVSNLKPMSASPVFDAPKPQMAEFEREEYKYPWTKMFLAARTNLLVPGMNFGAEFPIKDHWSVGFDYYFPWILPKNNEWCVEAIGGFIDAKYWFTPGKYKWTRTQRLQGHAVGVYAGIGMYDFQMKYNGKQGECLDVGVDYTFALPVANGKLRMEFNIGFGYIRTQFRPYYMSSDFKDLIKEPGNRFSVTNFVGPTKAAVSLVVPIVLPSREPKELRGGNE